MPPQPSPNYSQPKIRQIVFEAVFRNKRLFWLVVIGVVAAVAAVTFVMPRKYQAEAKLMVQNVRSSSPLTTTPNDRLVNSGTVAPEQISTQVELLQSSLVARRAVGASTREAGGDLDKAAEKLSKALKIEAVHQTNLIDLKLLGDSPTQAADQLRRVIDAYFTERAGSGLSSGAASFFDEQLRFKQKQLEIDQELLAAFQVKFGISDLDDEKKLQSQLISSLTSEYLSAEAQLAAQQRRTETNRRQLRITPARSATTERSITNQYSQEHFDTEMVDLQSRLTELLKRYPESDRQVVETREKIEIVRKAEASARSAPATERATDANPVYQQLSSAVATSAGEISARSGQVAKITQQLKHAQQRLEELNKATAQYEALKRDVAEAKRDYDIYAQKRDEARVSEELDKARLFDVSLVQPPIAASNAIRPRPKLYLAAGFVFSLLLATLLCIYVDISADTVYLPSQLDNLTGVRTVATVAEDRQPGATTANGVAYRRILLAIRNALRHREQENASQIKGLLPSSSGVVDARPATEPPATYGRCVAFVAALSGEGVTYLVKHLAEEAALHASLRVVVIDAALLLRQFASRGNAGFSLKKDNRTGFWSLNPDAPEDPEDDIDDDPRGSSLQSLFTWRLRPMMMQLRKDFDYVFIDCPNLADSTLSGELDRVVDGYIGVVGAGYARKQNIDGLAAMFEEASAPVLGYVLTRREYPVPRILHRIL